MIKRSPADSEIAGVGRPTPKALKELIYPGVRSICGDDLCSSIGGDDGSPKSFGPPPKKKREGRG